VKPNLKSQSGQLIVEAILIIVMLMGATFLAANYFKDKELLKKLVQAPWQSLAGMLQNGEWAPRDPSAASHPSGHSRHISIQGEYL
jgi:hypothetical protein